MSTNKKDEFKQGSLQLQLPMATDIVPQGFDVSYPASCEVCSVGIVASIMTTLLMEYELVSETLAGGSEREDI